jgi:hypothetical protein
MKCYLVQKDLAILTSERPKWNQFVINCPREARALMSYLCAKRNIGTLLIEVCLSCGDLIERITIRENKDNTTQ